MATTTTSLHVLTDRNIILKSSFFNSLSTLTTFLPRNSKTRTRIALPKASLNRRQLLADTATATAAAITLSSSAFVLPTKAEDQLSEWERVSLPIDPGVVLLDIAFVPDDTSHGMLCFNL